MSRELKRKSRERRNRNLRELKREVDLALLNLELLRNKTRLKFYRESMRLERKRVKRGLSKAYII